MTKADDLAQQLIELSVELVCSRGLENYSIRNVATAATCSTTPITSRFKDKSGLLQAAQEQAYRLDVAFHEKMTEETTGMPVTLDTLSSFIYSYVQQRSKLKVARFWSEALTKDGQGLLSKPVNRRWYEMRVDFWQRQLDRSEADLHPLLANIITDCVVMEEFYAYELGDDLHYQLLLNENLNSLLSRSFGVEPSAARGDIICWLNKYFPSFPDVESSEQSELVQRLLSLAGDAIRKKGLDALSQRTLTTKAGVSSAAIAYHFGNMANFTNQTLWYVLLREVPAQLDPKKVSRGKQKNLKEWTHLLQQLTRSSAGGQAPGFYYDYARLTGQACLRAQRDHILHPLVNHLRQIDGWGTYRSGNSYWPDFFKVDRGTAATFGVWIKGRSILQEAISDEAHIPEQMFYGVAEILL